MQYLKYLILALILFNIPSFLLEQLGRAGLASIVSYLSFLLLIIYFLLAQKGRVLWPFIFIGLSYYLLSGLQRHLPFDIFFTEAVKFFIVIICGNELSKRCNSRELVYFLLIGAISVLIQPLFFPDPNGRSSGFYLNPNSAGFICIVGYSLSYSIRKKYLKLLAQVIFTFVGLLTFSRTFIFIWVLVNVLSLFVEIKNVRVFIIGFLMIISLISFSEMFGLTGIRIDQLKELVNGKAKVSELNEDSRTDTWAQYYLLISNNPIWGNGAGTLRSDQEHDLQGVHNSYLLVWGEAGILAFIIFAGTFVPLVYRGTKIMKKYPHLSFISWSVALYLLTNHNFFNDNIIIFFCICAHNGVLAKTRYVNNNKVKSRMAKRQILRPAAS